MSTYELFIIAVGLSMDALAVAICKGLSMAKMSWRKGIIVGLWFGSFQALMPLIGYLLGAQFESKITAFDHWIAFIRLGQIGGNIIRDGVSGAQEKTDDSVSIKSMLPLAIATSIDALAVGVTFAFLRVNIVYAVSFIGVITFLLSTVGVKVGNVFGARYKSKAEIAGGVILILMGLKILIEHLMGG